MTPKEMIRELEDLEARADLIRSDLEIKRRAILAPVAGSLADLEAEYEPIMEQAAQMVASARERLVTSVKDSGETVKGERLMAVYNKPRVTWDGQALSGYAAAHPEIERFRKIGEPTVTVRAVGK